MHMCRCTYVCPRSSRIFFLPAYRDLTSAMGWGDGKGYGWGFPPFMMPYGKGKGKADSSRRPNGFSKWGDPSDVARAFCWLPSKRTPKQRGFPCKSETSLIFPCPEVAERSGFGGWA